jgi:hypothetical protein
LQGLVPSTFVVPADLDDEEDGVAAGPSAGALPRVSLDNISAVYVVAKTDYVPSEANQVR